MLDMNTGRFTWGEGLELYPGMSREDFLKSRVFENELLHEEDKLDIKGRRFDLRIQEIDGFQMGVAVELSIWGYVERIVLSKPEYYDWPNWPKNFSEEEYAQEIQKYNNAFVRKQVEESIAGNVVEENSYYAYCNSWGSINSMYDLRDIPNVEVKITYKNFGKGA